MNPFSKSLGILIPLLEKHRIEYMVFGGAALSVYGCPRLTVDVDIKILLPGGQEDYSLLIKIINPISTFLVEKPEQFIQETNVLPIMVEDSRIDLIIAELPFEKNAIKQSRKATLFGIQVNVCTPEDFIIQKAISTREKDWVDIQVVIENYIGELDWNYVMKHCRDLSEFLNNTMLIKRLEKIKDEK